MSIDHQVFELGARDIEALRWAARIADRNDQRRSLDGIYFDPKGRMVSTDGARMLIWRTSALDSLVSCVAAGPIDEVEVPTAEVGTLVVSPSEVILDCGKDGTCRLPVVGETYVDYEAALPDWSRLLVRVRSSVLTAMIDNALTKSVSPNVPLDCEILLDEAELTLYLEKGKLAIMVRQEPEGATGTGEPVFEESINVEVEGEVEEEEEAFRVGVNAHFLADSFRALQSAGDDVILIRFVDEYQPIVLSCEGNEDTRSVVMPVRLIRPEERSEEDASEEKDRWHHRAGSFARRPRRTSGIRIGRNAPCPCGSGKKYKKFVWEPPMTPLCRPRRLKKKKRSPSWDGCRCSSSRSPSREPNRPYGDASRFP